MRPHLSPVRARALAVAHHRQEAVLGAAVSALTTGFAALAAGWRLGGLALHMLGMAA